MPASIVSIAALMASAADALSSAVTNGCSLRRAPSGFTAVCDTRARHLPWLCSKALMVNCLYSTPVEWLAVVRECLPSRGQLEAKAWFQSGQCWSIDSESIGHLPDTCWRDRRVTRRRFNRVTAMNRALLLEQPRQTGRCACERAGACWRRWSEHTSFSSLIARALADCLPSARDSVRTIPPHNCD
jgi:hypothetical protein